MCEKGQKKVVALLLSLMMVVCNIACASALEKAVVKDTNIVTHSVSYVGGGKSPYTENGNTYYYGGNIIKLTINLPANTGACGVSEVISYDSSKLELQDSFVTIKNSIGSTLSSSGWENTVMKYDNASNKIWVDSIAADLTNGTNNSGGTVATISFKILGSSNNSSLSSTGTSINFGFTHFSMIAYNGKLPPENMTAFIHAGYDGTNSTLGVNLPSLKITSNKKPTTTTPPSSGTIIPDGSGVDKNITLDSKVVEEVSSEIPKKKLDEIAEAVKTKSYSFKLNDQESLSGSNSYDEIASLVDEDLSALKNDKNYKVFSFKSNKKTDVKVETDEPQICYTHWILLAISAVVLAVTIGYTKYKNKKNSEEWENE
ncbi:MAG: hypothetical protein PHH04_07010 [Thomasclavelia sp.]|jgi:hypothetical protein|nr:hypothetical protein [Thomasclavelia sp.]